MLGRERIRALFDQFRKVKLLFVRPPHELVLNDLLCQMTANSTLLDQMFWFEQILRWLFQHQNQRVEARFRFFFQVLERNPAWRQNFEQTFNSILLNCKFLSLFTHVGMAVDHGLWGDIAQRITEKIIPTGGKTDFQEILFQTFRSPAEILAMKDLSEETLLKIRSLIATPKNEQIWKQIQSKIREAELFLSIHAAHYGMGSEIRNRIASGEIISQSAFFALATAFQNESDLVYESTLVACESSVSAVFASMEESGVSVDVVNRLETLTSILLQIRRLLKLQTPLPDTETAKNVRDFLAHAAEAGIRGRSVIAQVRHHFYLLSRKIVERNGQSGDHYIARDAKENRKLFVSAIGGGFIVVFMTIAKTLLIQLDVAPLFLATGIWAIYSAGFLSMQFAGCTLATKIPSFTASRLAGLLRTVRKLESDGFRSEVKLVIRSQTLALLGNLIGVIPLGILINFLWQWVSRSTGLMDEHYAHHILHDIHPFLSFAVPLGALTGLQLWLSSIAGGWFENWIVFKRVPTLIRTHHRIRKIFDESFAKRLSVWILANASGIATNLSLGFLFGFVPMFGGLFGANWNGNHVTISTASAAFALSSLNFELPVSTWFALGLGIFLIAVMNFAVSFGLALYVAGSAQKMKFWRVVHYLRISLASRDRF